MSMAKLRLAAYIIALGGLGISSIVYFNKAQYSKAKYKASNAHVESSLATLTSLYTTYPDALTDTSNERAHDKALWYNDIYETMYVINEQNRDAYILNAIPAYALSTLTLVAFGLVLKIEEKAKEREDKKVTK